MYKKRIYTIGSSTRGSDEFIELLEYYGIQTLVDVRRFPTSKLEHFKRENLAHILSEAGIGYVYLGEELGGYRSGGYEAHTLSQQFREGIKSLEGVATRAKTVVMCSERLPWKCHRRFIGRELQRREWEVIHIIDEKRQWISRGESP
ncbi:MAG: DUF488 domain-containing protein [Actinomycetota bacterium]